MVMPLALSCNKNTTNPSGTTPESSEVEGAPVDTTRDDLPELDYDGEEIVFLTHENQAYVKETTFESETAPSDIVDMAVWNRERTVENRLNIEIKNVQIKDAEVESIYHIIPEYFRKEVLAGTNYYDIGVGNMCAVISGASEGIYWDLLKVPNIDTTKTYYSQMLKDDSMFGGKLFCLTGDAATTFITYSYVMYFNKDMAVEYNCGDLYQLALDGKWARETQMNMSKNVWKDTNGDSKKDNGDTFGFVIQTEIGIDPYPIGADIYICSRNAAGELETSLNVDKAASFLKSFNDYRNKSTGTFVFPVDDWGRGTKMFVNDQALFISDKLAICAGGLRNMETSYGVLPHPKYDASQVNYQTFLGDCASVYAVCSAVPESKLAMIGATIECMFSESETVRFALFEQALKVKYQRDDTASQILDIVINNVSVDPAILLVYPTDYKTFIMRDMFKKRSSIVAGYWKTNEGGIKKAIVDFDSDIRKLK